MYEIMLALHLLTAIFAIGPLVAAATTAGRGLRNGDAAASADAARTLTIYSYASVLVVIFGSALVTADAPWDPDQPVASFGELWVWLSVVLWVCAMALVLGMAVPALKQAAALTEGTRPADTLVGKVAASGGIVGLIFAVIVFLMVYQPGS